MAKYTLYGDGIHDDTDAIQELIDSGVCEVLLPAPKVRYLISKPLIIPSNFKLKLPRYAEIKLADGQEAYSFTNLAKYAPDGHIYSLPFVDKGVTSISKELAREVSFDEASKVLCEKLLANFGLVKG